MSLEFMVDDEDKNSDYGEPKLETVKDDDDDNLKLFTFNQTSPITAKEQNHGHQK